MFKPIRVGSGGVTIPAAQQSVGLGRSARDYWYLDRAGQGCQSGQTAIITAGEC
jgi:hypothetical protein